MKRSILYSFVLLLFVLCANSAEAQYQPDGSIAVTGEATLKATPDRALVVMSVSTTEQTPALAKSANDSIVAKVLASARNEGVASEDIQTDLVSLQQHYSYSNSMSKPDGYTMRKEITMRVVQLKNFDLMLSALLSAGVSSINSIELQSSTMKELQRQAEDNAVKDAAEHASRLAKDFGVKLGKPTRITQTRSEIRSLRMNTNSAAADFVQSSEQGQEAFALGQLTVRSSVSVQYSMHQPEE